MFKIDFHSTNDDIHLVSAQQSPLVDFSMSGSQTSPSLISLLSVSILGSSFSRMIGKYNVQGKDKEVVPNTKFGTSHLL